MMFFHDKYGGSVVAIAIEPKYTTGFKPKLKSNLPVKMITGQELAVLDLDAVKANMEEMGQEIIELIDIL